MAVLKKGAGSPGAERTKLASGLKKPYDKGASIRELAERTAGRTASSTACCPSPACTLRGRGGATRTKSAKKGNAEATSSLRPCRTRIDPEAGFRVDLRPGGRHGHPRPTRAAQRPDPGHVDRAGARRGASLPGDVRVVVLRGAGPSVLRRAGPRVFAPARVDGDPRAGLAAMSPGRGRPTLIAGSRRRSTGRRDRDLVSVAAVQGHAIGAGFQLALAADLRIARRRRAVHDGRADARPGARPRRHEAARRARRLLARGRDLPDRPPRRRRGGLRDRPGRRRWCPAAELDAAVERPVAALLAVDRDAAVETKALLLPRPARARRTSSRPPSGRPSTAGCATLAGLGD